MMMARRARSHPLGPLHPSFNLLQMVKDSLLSSLPDDAHILVSGRLCVSLTRVPDGKNVLVSEFHSREELVEVRGPRVEDYHTALSTPHISACIHSKMASFQPISPIKTVSCAFAGPNRLL